MISAISIVSLWLLNPTKDLRFQKPKMFFQMSTFNVIFPIKTLFYGSSCFQFLQHLNRRSDSKSNSVPRWHFRIGVVTLSWLLYYTCALPYGHYFKVWWHVSGARVNFVKRREINQFSIPQTSLCWTYCL